MTNVLEIFAIIVAMGLSPYPTEVVEPPTETHIEVSTPTETKTEKNIEKSVDNTPTNVVVCESKENTEESEPNIDEEISVEKSEEPIDKEEEKVYYYYEQEQIFPEPYVENQVFTLCEDEEHALKLAEEYDFTLESYSYGVAVFNTNGKDPLDYVGEGSIFELNYIYTLTDPIQPKENMFDNSDVFDDTINNEETISNEVNEENEENEENGENENEEECEILD